MKKKLSKYVKAIISYTLFILCKELFFFFMVFIHDSTYCHTFYGKDICEKLKEK